MARVVMPRGDFLWRRIVGHMGGDQMLARPTDYETCDSARPGGIHSALVGDHPHRGTHWNGEVQTHGRWSSNGGLIINLP